MNCDQAFDLMTSAAATGSRALQSHLESCPRCQQMRETLSPALELFDRVETMPTGATATTTSTRLAERIAVRLSEAAPVVRRDRQHGRRFAAVVALTLLGFLTGLGLAGLLPTSPASGHQLASECTWVNHLASRSEKQRSETVVLSCVACHLSAAPE